MSKLSYIFVTITAMATIFITEKDAVFAENKKTCVENNQLEWDRFNMLILDDIQSSFRINLNGYKEMPFWETNRQLRLDGNRQESLTFQELFRGSSIGARRLFIRSEDNHIAGYLLYKQLDGTNIVQNVVKEKGVWILIATNKIKARRFYANFINCQKDS